MNRIIAGLVLLIALLAAAEFWILHRRESARVERSLLRPLLHARAEVVPERVRAIQIHRGGESQVWTYEKQGRHWRFPGSFDAYVRADRVDFMLRSILQTLGTFVSDDEGLHRYGLTADEALRIALFGAADEPLLELWVGDGVAGAAAAEVYVKKTAVDTVLHWHANPRHALDAGNPPMIDPLVLPQALARQPIAVIRFEGGGDPAVRSLRRIEVPTSQEGTAAALPPLAGSTFAWLATVDGREDTCLNQSVSAYSSFLTRLRYRRVHDPRQGGYGFADGRRLELEDEEGVVDVLEVGGAASKETVYLRNEAAGMVYSVDRARAELLFPKAEYLLGPLPEPSPYGR